MRTLAIDPNNSYAWNNKGNALHNLGKYNEAIKCYDEAIELEPSNAYAWHNREVCKAKTDWLAKQDDYIVQEMMKGSKL